MFGIIKGSDRSVYQQTVWSLYAPPIARDPSLALKQAGAKHSVFGMSSFLDLRVLWPLVRQLRIARPDILHCHLVRANLYGRIAAKLAGIPVVISTHHGIEQYMVGHSFIDRAVRAVERISNKWVTCHVGVSEAVRSATITSLNVNPDDAVTVPNGVDLGVYQARLETREHFREEMGLKPTTVLIGSVGLLNRTKNFELLLSVANLISKAHPQARFVIAGDGVERRNLEVAISALELRDHVKLLGFRSDIPQVLNALDVFVSTSNSEGFGLAVAEAMAAGLACVVFDVGALGELILNDHTGFLVPVGDIPAFVAALNRLIDNPSLRSKMGKAGQTRVRRLFSMELMARRHNENYERLLNRISEWRLRRDPQIA